MEGFNPMCVPTALAFVLIVVATGIIIVNNVRNQGKK